MWSANFFFGYACKLVKPANMNLHSYVENLLVSDEF